MTSTLGALIEYAAGIGDQVLLDQLYDTNLILDEIRKSKRRPVK